MERAQYTPSGKMGVLAIPAALVTGAVVAVVGGYVYQLIVYWVGPPLAYFGSLPTLAFTLLIGMSTSLALTWGKAQNVNAAFAMGVVAGLLAVGFTHHLSYRWNTEEWAAQAERWLAANPTEVRAEADDATRRIEELRSLSAGPYIRERIRRGWRALPKPVSAAEVWAGWLLEALALCVGGGMLATVGATGPFCERCEEHTRERRIGTIHGLDPVAVRGAAMKRGIPGVLALESGSGRANVVVTMSACPRCSRTKFVGVKAVWTRPRKIQRPRARITETMFENAILPPAELRALEERFPHNRRRPARA